MAALLTNATAAGFGFEAGVAVSNKDAGIFTKGLVTGWGIDLYFSDTDDIGTAVQLVSPVINPKTGRGFKRNYLRISTNGAYNFPWLPADGFIWAKLNGGRNALTCNCDITFGA